MLPVKSVGLLGLHPQTGIVLGDAVPGHDPRHAHLLGGGDGQGPAAELVQAALHQVDGIDAHHLRRGAVDPAAELPGEVLEDDPVELGQLVGIGEYSAAQPLPVEAVFIEHRAEGPLDGPAEAGIGAEHLMINGVAVQHQAPQHPQGL